MSDKRKAMKKKKEQPKPGLVTSDIGTTPPAAPQTFTPKAKKR
jgi:hypothetical protein